MVPDERRSHERAATSLPVEITVSTGTVIEGMIENIVPVEAILLEADSRK
jgi:hypothetical protein